MKLSIIVPVYNEEKTIITILNKLLDLKVPNFKKEIIVVDDGSTDGTIKKLSQYMNNKTRILVFKNIKNSGKGSAIIKGFKEATGDYILIQDADLEYDPKDIPILLNPIITKKAEAVYGTRLKRLPNFKRDERSLLFFFHYLGNKVLSLLTSILFGKWITDMETGYKIFPARFIKENKFESKGFDIEPELTAKLLKSSIKIVEVPIRTNPRSYAEGKKINTLRDGTKACIALLRFRFSN